MQKAIPQFSNHEMLSPHVVDNSGQSQSHVFSTNPFALLSVCTGLHPALEKKTVA